MCERLRVDPASPDPSAVERAADVLRRGGLVAFPTETVYGLGAHALDAVAVRRIFEAKGRPAHDPLIVHVAAASHIAPLIAAAPLALQRLAARFWPGPLTVVLPRSSAIPDEVTAGLSTVAVRVPSHPVAQRLLEAAALPVAAPSANLFSRPSPTRAEHVLQDLAARIDLILDAGPTAVGVESTVLDLSVEPPIILRPGAVTLEMLRDTLPGITMRSPLSASPEGPMTSPGLLAKHYSPRAPLTLYEGAREDVLRRIARDMHDAEAAGTRVGVIAADKDEVAGLVKRLGDDNDLQTVARHLYAALRELDDEGVELILVRAFPATDGLGAAIHDRLRRAAAGRIVRVDGRD